LQILRLYENNPIFPENFPEFGAGDNVIIALASGRSVVGMLYHHGLQLGIVVTEVNNHFGEAGLQIFSGV
jgi:hypothetical protein